MAKKQFTQNFQDIFSPTVGQPKDNLPDSTQGKEKRFDDSNEAKRTTLLLSRGTYNDIRAIAHWERCQIKELLEDALKSIVNSYTPEQLASIRKEFSRRGKAR